MSDEQRGDDSGDGKRERSLGQLGVLGAVALFVLLFVVLNDDKVKVSFVLFSQRTSLWVALIVAAGLGFAGGYLARRSREQD